MRDAVEKTLTILAEDYTKPILKSHKLKGDLQGCWSCSIDYSNRIIFEFVTDPDNSNLAINLLTLGSHDDVD